MGIEIEKKFLTTSDVWKTDDGVDYRQGYLSSDKRRVVRVRLIGDKGYITVKGMNKGASRLEFEYEIPYEDANEMLRTLCEQPIIEKRRYRVPIGDVVFEVDEYFNENSGLVVAEVELENEWQQFDHPEWLGKEVTGDSRYFNSNLIKNPFCRW